MKYREHVSYHDGILCIPFFLSKNLLYRGVYKMFLKEKSVVEK